MPFLLSCLIGYLLSISSINPFYSKKKLLFIFRIKRRVDVNKEHFVYQIGSIEIRSINQEVKFFLFEKNLGEYQNWFFFLLHWVSDCDCKSFNWRHIITIYYLLNKARFQSSGFIRENDDILLNGNVVFYKIIFVCIFMHRKQNKIIPKCSPILSFF